MNRLLNFSAGPGALPLAVLEEARGEMLSYADAGASVMEISHRSRQYAELSTRAISNLKALLNLDDSWHVLFLQGGASAQFYQVPLNFLEPGGTADYLVTGAWSKKAVVEAKRCGNVNVAASGAENGFNAIPAPGIWRFSDKASYIHYTSNNTIFGTQYSFKPEVNATLVCDASSDFLSRPTDFSGHGLVYAGAQKNVGPAGVTVVLVKDDFLKSRNGDLPTILDYGTHTAKLFNTPPVFAVYMVDKVLTWIQNTGGLQAMGVRNERKALALYERIDRTDFYRGTAEKSSRSQMNVTFRLESEDLESSFVAEASSEGMAALKGHRSVGGIRASIYNACPPEAVQTLISFMDAFEEKYG
jgi:phosphoserine aminotransferase